MNSRPLSWLLKVASVALLPLAFSNCTHIPFGRDTHNKMIVSVSDQRMILLKDGRPVKTYPISTSKFGVGDRPSSNCTPLGRLQIAKKIGSNCPLGTVFKGRKPTGEILKPNTPGRDPVVTRILWLTGTEPRNRNTYNRTIYIHGTPEENRLGSPASFGCIRMSSRDVRDLYDRVGYGADVFVIRGSANPNSKNNNSANTASISKSNISG